MIYSIPNDDYKTFRRKCFFELLGTEDYVDGATDFCLLLPFAKYNNLSIAERLWIAYLYGLSYSNTTAIRLFCEFNSLDNIKYKQLSAFWNNEKSTLWFNPDKKYIKNNNQVIPAISSLRQWCNKDLSGSLQNILEQGFEATYKEIQKNWNFFGPHGAYLFFDALYGLCPELYTEPIALDWKHCGKTVTEGMAHLLYKDDCIESGHHNFEYYNKIVDKINIKSGRPKIMIESTLCAFRKLFKQSRYYGYYADRMLEECINTEDYLKPLGVDIWKYRKDTIPKEFRGEDNGWKGVRKERCKLFMEKGILTDC